MIWNQKDLIEPRWIEGQVYGMNELFANDNLEQILDWACENFSPSLHYECSFSDRDFILLDAMERRNIWPKIYVLSKFLKDDETSRFVDFYRSRGFNIRIFSEPSLPHNAQIEIDRLERRQALAEASGWVHGSKAVSELNDRLFTIDEQHDGILKISPLALWSDNDIKDYIKKTNLPYGPDIGEPLHRNSKTPHSHHLDLNLSIKKSS